MREEVSACARRPPEVVEPEAATAPPQAAPEPEVADEGPPPSNIDLELTLERASGTTLSGHLVRLERSVDFYAEEGWTHDAADLVLSLETDMALKKAPWTEVSTITIKQAAPGDVSCFYDSDYSPPMYQCILKTSPTVTLTDGSSYTTTMRHRWRLSLESGDVVELHLYKLPEREQTTSTEDEDYALYEALQARVLATAAAAPVKITLAAP